MTAPSQVPERGDSEQLRALVRASVAGDVRAQDDLARWLLEHVRRTVFLARGGGGDAEDLVQGIVVKVFAELENLHEPASFRAWVDRITMNTIRDLFRAQRRWRWLPFEERRGPPPDEQDGPERAVDQNRLFRRLQRHFLTLSPSLRLPLLLSMLHGYSAPEIAVLLDIRPDAARKRVYRARREIAQRLKDDPYCSEVLRDWAR